MPDRHAAKLTIRNKLGLHARPATAFADVANAYACVVTVRKGDETFDGKSIMELMMLAATQGTEIDVEAVGDGAADCLASLTDLVNRGFDED
ncbi:MAG: HPr family phosphocarrier protein [Phycisphaerales bacterium]